MQKVKGTVETVSKLGTKSNEMGVLLHVFNYKIVGFKEILRVEQESGEPLKAGQELKGILGKALGEGYYSIKLVEGETELENLKMPAKVEKPVSNLRVIALDLALKSPFVRGQSHATSLAEHYMEWLQE